MKNSFLERLFFYAENTPDKIALQYNSTKKTYEELFWQANALGFALQQQVGDKKTILVYGHKSIDMPLCFVASLFAECIYLPIDSSLPIKRVQTILAQTPVDFVLAVETLPIELETFPHWTKEAMLEKILEKNYFSMPFFRQNFSCYKLFTSGSTGTPKEVIISYKNLHNFLLWFTKQVLKKSHCETITGHALYTFDLSVADLYGALYNGKTHTSISQNFLQDTAEIFAQLQTTEMLVATPSFAKICLRENNFNSKNYTSLKTFFFCGEVLPTKLAQSIFLSFPDAKIWNAYGPTEATVAVSVVEISQKMLCAPLPIGKEDSLACKVEIQSSSGKISPEETIGEIVISGNSVSESFCEISETIPPLFYSTPTYRTGDFGRWSKDGYLYWNGRQDNQVKRNGYRIELGEIERALENFPYVQDAIVLSTYKNEKTKIIAFVQTKDNNTLSNQEIKKEFSKYLPLYFFPDTITYVKDFPVSQNNKLDIAALKRMSQNE